MRSGQGLGTYNGSISNLQTGTYYEQSVDFNGCSTVSEFIINEPDELVASALTFDALCNGGFGSAILDISGGTPPYVTEDLSNLVAGDYETIVSDANNC